MAVYENENAFVADYVRLTDEYKVKVGRYIKNLLKLQRAELGVTAKLHTLDLKRKRENANATAGYVCNFCGKSEDEVFRMLVGQDKSCICDECANICREVLEEISAEEK